MTWLKLNTLFYLEHAAFTASNNTFRFVTSACCSWLRSTRQYYLIFSGKGKMTSLQWTPQTGTRISGCHFLTQNSGFSGTLEPAAVHMFCSRARHTRGHRGSNRNRMKHLDKLKISFFCFSAKSLDQPECVSCRICSFLLFLSVCLFFCNASYTIFIRWCVTDLFYLFFFLS